MIGWVVDSIHKSFKECFSRSDISYSLMRWGVQQSIKFWFDGKQGCKVSLSNWQSSTSQISLENYATLIHIWKYVHIWSPVRYIPRCQVEICMLDSIFILWEKVGGEARLNILRKILLVRNSWTVGLEFFKGTMIF